MNVWTGIVRAVRRLTGSGDGAANLMTQAGAPWLLTALEALAVAIDAQDQTHRPHIPRMRRHATAVARALGMSETEVQGVDADVIQQVAVPAGEGLTGWVARNRRPLVNARPSADLEAAGLMHLTTTLQSALVCPLMFNEHFIGTLSVYHTGAAFYGVDHMRLLNHVSEQAAAVINNSMLFEQTQEDSLTDWLTGLPNPRFLYMHVTRELARAERLKAEVAVFVIDYADLAGTNSTHGHHVGDRALCEIARVLRAAIRPHDIAVRYGAHTFIVVLSGCGADEAEHHRQEFRRSIDEIYFEASPGRRLKLTIKAGGAIFPQDGQTHEALLATADSRMFADTR